MKTLNYKQIMKEAKDKEISPYLIVKRKLNYRKIEGGFSRCRNCKHYVGEVKNANGSWIQCHIIGVGCDGYSQVEDDYICDVYK